MSLLNNDDPARKNLSRRQFLERSLAAGAALVRRVEALFALASRRSGDGPAVIYDFDLLTAYLLHNPRGLASCAAARDLQEKLGEKIDARYDMRNTLQHLLANNLNLSLAAKTLYIHRNTLVFRLKKLEQLTGLKPGQDINHAILCKILCG
jgi:carbohydrate diacid regulator